MRGRQTSSALRGASGTSWPRGCDRKEEPDENVFQKIRNPQALADEASALSSALRSHRCLVAQLGGALACHLDRAASPARHTPRHPGARGGHLELLDLAQPKNLSLSFGLRALTKSWPPRSAFVKELLTQDTWKPIAVSRSESGANERDRRMISARRIALKGLG